jgi:hypothetical protein
MKKEFLKFTGITEDMYKAYCESHDLNWKSKDVEEQFIKDVYDKKIVIDEGELK